MSDNTATAIIVLAIVILILGAPFALNEYSKWQEREKINRIMNQPRVVEKPITFVKTVISTIQTPTPILQPKITDGSWCRNLQWDVGGVSTTVTECYQFFSDGNYTTKNTAFPILQKKHLVNCRFVQNEDLVDEQICDLDTWRVNSKGEYEIWGNTFTLKGKTLTSTADYPPYTWSSTGIS